MVQLPNCNNFQLNQLFPKETFYDDRELYVQLLASPAAMSNASAPYERRVDESEEARRLEECHCFLGGKSWETTSNCDSWKSFFFFFFRTNEMRVQKFHVQKEEKSLQHVQWPSTKTKHFVLSQIGFSHRPCWLWRRWRLGLKPAPRRWKVSELYKW